MTVQPQPGRHGSIGDAAKPHGAIGAPSPWVMRFAPLIKPCGRVLDYACGDGRHSQALGALGYHIEAVDRDTAAVQALRDSTTLAVTVREADLEADEWPFHDERYDAVVVTNYLYRPHFQPMLDLLDDGGVLIYETFMVGNERFGRPKNPDFLLQPNELFERLRGTFTVLAFEQGEVERPARAMVQRVCAIRAVDRFVSVPV